MRECETVTCKFCFGETRMAGTKLCDFCWELERRIRNSKPSVLLRILEYHGYRINDRVAEAHDA